MLSRALYRVIFLLLLVTIPAFGYGAEDLTSYCAMIPGTVWSRVSNQCVQEVCPVDSIGRDVQEQCICPSNTDSIQEKGILVACTAREVPKQPTGSSRADTAKKADIPTFELVPAGLTSNSGTSTATSSAATLGLRRRGLTWPIAVPSTITLLFVGAIAIAYKLLK